MEHEIKKRLVSVLEDADSFLGERKDSTIIIASAAEEETPRRNFDFCQVAVLLSELQLLVGILAVTFAISMHTSPSIPHCYTPHWAGVPVSPISRKQKRGSFLMIFLHANFRTWKL